MIRFSGGRKKKSQCTEEVERAEYFSSAAITVEDISSSQSWERNFWLQGAMAYRSVCRVNEVWEQAWGNAFEVTAGGPPCFCAFRVIAHVWLHLSSDSEVSVLAGVWQDACIKGGNAAPGGVSWKPGLEGCWDPDWGPAEKIRSTRRISTKVWTLWTTVKVMHMSREAR